VEGIVSYIVVGLIVGLAARLVMPGSHPIGLIGTITVGIVGAIIGGYAWRQLFGNTEDVEWIGSILAAMALLWIYRRATTGRGTLV
jgi:uncharacterized membrane protein YeaQ/YmgE (transglycosylase-associated protein family)